MLSGMRAFAKSKWALVMLVLLVLALAVGVGISNPFTGVAGGGFVRAGSESYGARDANRFLQRYVDNIQAETGEYITNEEAAKRGIPLQIVNELAQQATLLAYAEKLGVRASPKAVSAIFADAPRFKDALGRVNVTEIARFAGEQGYRDTRELEESQRDGITLQYLEQAAFSGLVVPDILVEPLVGYVGERRKLSFARLGPDSLSEPAAPTDEELAAFYDERRGMFRQPERRSVSALIYSPSDFEDQADITEEDLRENYEARIREFSTTESREISQFSAASSGAVQEVVDLVKQGITLTDAAARVAGVTLEQRKVTEDDIEDEQLKGLVFGIAEGDIYGPVPIGEQSIGVQVNAVEVGEVTPFEDVADQIRSDIAGRSANSSFRSTEEDFYDLVGAGEPLEEIAKELGVPVIAMVGIDRNGRTETHGPTDLFAITPNALAEVFEISTGETTDILESNGARAVYRLDAIIEPYEPPLADIRDDLTQLYKASKQVEAAGALVQEALDKIKSGEDFDAAVKASNLLPFHPEEVMNRPLDPNASDPILMAAFNLPLNEPSIVNDQRGEPWIVRVDEILPTDPEIASQIRTQLGGQIMDSLGGDIRQSFWQGVQARVKLRTNDNAINQYLTSFTEPTE